MFAKSLQDSAWAQVADALSKVETLMCGFAMLENYSIPKFKNKQTK